MPDSLRVAKAVEPVEAVREKAKVGEVVKEEATDEQDVTNSSGSSEDTEDS